MLKLFIDQIKITMGFMLVVFSVSILDGQELKTDNPNFVKKALLKINFLSPSIHGELGINNKSTINFDFFSDLYIQKGGRGFSISNIGVALNLETEYRYYYNFIKRANKGKSTYNNAASYFSIPIVGSYRFPTSLPTAPPGSTAPPKQTEYLIGLLPRWGIQRNYGKSFTLNFSLGGGIGYDISRRRAIFMPSLKFELGFIAYQSKEKSHSSIIPKKKENPTFEIDTY